MGQSEDSNDETANGILLTFVTTDIDAFADDPGLAGKIDIFRRSADIRAGIIERSALLGALVRREVPMGVIAEKRRRRTNDAGVLERSCVIRGAIDAKVRHSKKWH